MPLREKAILHRLRRVPLYLQIVVALALGVIVGIFLTPERAVGFDIPARLILRLLGAIAPPLILVAVMRALISAKVQVRLAGKMFYLLVLNTLVAFFVGLLVANVIRPGRHAAPPPNEAQPVAGAPVAKPLDNIHGI